EERRGSLTSGGRKDRRIAKREAIIVEEIPHRLNYCMPNFQYSMLPARTQPQMPVVHQKLCAVFLWSDRIFMYLLENFCIDYIDLETARRASVSTHRPSDRKC